MPAAIVPKRIEVIGNQCAPKAIGQCPVQGLRAVNQQSQLGLLDVAIAAGAGNLLHGKIIVVNQDAKALQASQIADGISKAVGF